MRDPSVVDEEGRALSLENVGRAKRACSLELRRGGVLLSNSEAKETTDLQKVSPSGPCYSTFLATEV